MELRLSPLLRILDPPASSLSSQCEQTHQPQQHLPFETFPILIRALDPFFGPHGLDRSTEMLLLSDRCKSTTDSLTERSEQTHAELLDCSSPCLRKQISSPLLNLKQTEFLSTSNQLSTSATLQRGPVLADAAGSLLTVAQARTAPSTSKQMVPLPELRGPKNTIRMCCSCYNKNVKKF